MSDYSKTTNFTAKDALASGNPAKVIKGSEHDTEYDNIATAIATKIDEITSPTTDALVTQTASGNIQDAGVATFAAGIATDLVDASGNEVLKRGSVGSAVNELTVTNAATLNSPSVSATGGDTDIDLTLSPKGAGDIVADPATGDVNVLSTGTGDLLVRSTPVHGSVTLDTPEVLGTATTNGSWVTISSTTLATALSTSAKIRLSATSASTGAKNIQFYLRKTGSALAANGATLVGQGFDNGTLSSTSLLGAGSGWVNLDTSYDFDYQINSSGATLSSVSVVLEKYEA